MAFQKPRGSQLDIQSIAADISADSTAIGNIATGIASDPGATATLDAEYLRRDGTGTMDGVLTMNNAAIVADPTNPSGMAYAFDPSFNDGFSSANPGQIDFVLGSSVAFSVDAAGNLPPGPEVKSNLPLRMNSIGAPATRDIINVNNMGVSTINGQINVDVSDIGVSVEPYDAAIQTHLSNATIHFTEASIDHANILNIGTNSHAQIDTHISDATTHRVINDAGTSVTELWSASKINTDLGTKASSVHTHVKADITDFTHAHSASDITSGTLADALVAVSNVTQHQASLLITESQISDLTHIDAYTKAESDAVGPSAGSKVDKIAGVSGNIVEFGASNAIADSGIATSSLAPLASPVFTGIPQLPTTSKAALTLGLGNATEPAGSVVFVIDDAGATAFIMAWVDGTSTWIRSDTGAAIS